MPIWCYVAAMRPWAVAATLQGDLTAQCICDYGTLAEQLSYFAIHHYPGL